MTFSAPFHNLYFYNLIMGIMKLAVDSFSYHLHFGKHWFVPSKQYDLQWYCGLCKNLKLDGLHIDPMHIDISKDIGWLKEFSEENNLYIELGAMGINYADLDKPLEAARYLGSKVLRTFVGGSCDEGREATKIKAERAKQELLRSLENAEKMGVVIALENHADLYSDDIKRILEIDSPFLGLCYDAGNFFSIGEDPLEAVKMFAEKIVCTHLKDVLPPETYPDAQTFGSGNYKTHFCALGDGKMPLKDIMNVIRKSKGEDFNITLEIHTPHRKSLSEDELLAFEIENVIKSVHYAKNILAV